MSGFITKPRMEVRPGDLQWFLDLHDSLRWQFAYTMPHVPHSWVWKGRQISETDYDRAFGVIRTFGETGKYWDRTQLYLHNRERNLRYWLMDRHHYTCKIINMADDGKEYGTQDAPVTRTEGWSPYDAIAPWWDDEYRDFTDFDQAVLWKSIHQNASLVKPTMLDIGAGTGASLDARITSSENTLAVEPSQGMLNDLVVKYPKVNTFPGTFAQFLASARPKIYDVVIASTGSASYLTAEEIWAANSMATQMVLLSFYGSVPSHLEEMPLTHADALSAAASLPGAVSLTHGNFVHVLTRGRSTR